MVGAGIAALLVTLATTPIVLGAMRRLAAIDEVNERSSHQVPTPRGGGIAVALGLFAGVVVLMLVSDHADTANLLPMTVGVTLFGLIGLAEDTGGDIGGIAPLRRLALQLLAGLVASALVLASVALDAASPLPAAALLAAALIGPLWVTAFVNAYNFMDGINGISAVQAAVAGGALAVVGHLHDSPVLTAGGAVLAGAAIGFAPFNFPRARIFLGDVGSYTLGASLAVLALQGVVSGIPAEAVLAPLLLYLADTGVTLARRVRQGECWYLPHRTHTYQQLTDMGWTHTRVTATVACLGTAVSGLGQVAAGGGTGVRVAADLAITAILAGYLNAPRLVASAHAHGRTHPATEPVPINDGVVGLAVPRQRLASDGLAPGAAEVATRTGQSG